MAKRSDLKKLIPNAIVKGIQDTLEDIFAQSQEYVPVDNGILVNSGDVIPLKNGGQIIYTAPYAARMEFGDSFLPFRGTLTVSFSTGFGFSGKFCFTESEQDINIKENVNIVIRIIHRIYFFN